MNEWLKKLFTQIKDLWAKWSVVQKVIISAVAAVIILALILIPTVSSQPTTVPLFSTIITDEVLRDEIIFRLDEENVPVTIVGEGMLHVQDEATARRMRSILVTDGLVPDGIDPFDIFNVSEYSSTQFHRDVQLQRAITLQLKSHIEAIEGIERADVMLGMPETTVFGDEQLPTTASVILTQSPGGQITSEKKKIEGIQKLLTMAIPGLTDEYITISDSYGIVLNDFEGLADIERVDIIEKEQLLIRDFENQKREEVLVALQNTYSTDRVRELNVSIEMDMSQIEIDRVQYDPFVRVADNPNTPFDDSQVFDSVTIASQEINKEHRGTSFNPEGPAGVDGQNPPVYSDMSNVYGITTESSITRNEAINTSNIREIRSPAQGRRTVSVNIDGTWKRDYDEEGKLIISPSGEIQRTYVPLTEDEIEDIESIIQGAVGYDQLRGDSVVVRNIAFDRTAQFAAEDAEFLRQEQTRQTILIAIVSIIAILLAFIIVRFVTRELERRRRLREEELLRKHQLERERTLWEAQQAGMEVTMSVEERERAELQENAITIAREHPEDVAMLIRSWLMEE